LPSLNMAAQSEENIWGTLALLGFEPKNEMGYFDAESNIISMIKALEGKEVIVKGYFIPLSGKKAQSHFMFSAYPYETCFFCGKAGPETVMEVFVKNDNKIDFTEKKIALKGMFHFTSLNPEDVMFTLKDAELAD